MTEPDHETLDESHEAMPAGESQLPTSPVPTVPEPVGAEVLEEAVEDALDFLEGLLDAMDLDADVEAEIAEDGGIRAWFTGPDSGLIIGRRGQSLDAIQELLRTTVQRRAQTRIRVNLDAEGYRERRKEALIAETALMAEKAKEQGEAEFEPMSAYERKLVHDAASQIPGIVSVSEGEDPRRRVILKASD